MDLLQKGDLHFTDYSWTAIKGDDPRITGEPDSTLFNRHEGYEMLYMINKLAERYGWTFKHIGQKAERMLHQHLPGDIRSQSNVVLWLERNWASF